MSRFSLSDFLVGLINFTFGLAMLGLVFRFLFRLFGANPTADIVEFLYTSTAPLLSPFRGIFEPYVVDPGNVLEFSTLIAIAFYALAAWLLTELVLVLTDSFRSYRDRSAR
ncbi:MAG: YGGT family protein [candidate division WS6 bacterium OLB20]|uniref:YGGT family protein n=1 Tax=candidate division WS6 bacterium OLB20 TaxID=1617426 RepID=A0A136LWZ3_9BACT|nr:MAG: YGGT family protein [candidate division WS6 bacterium OLB20]